ncbi:hypothetical protein KP509_22G051500 [Ceratopteris richardii]|uniref:Uncharacterized protein n=1 Tax=Ceratopteris richardii TaxID=49495 RepID=A0A8T2S510_CERRI|nr:hypothetical protein KP509_22G051500 [Ceratopteris richardii]
MPEGQKSPISHKTRANFNNYFKPTHRDHLLPQSQGKCPNTFGRGRCLAGLAPSLEASGQTPSPMRGWIDVLNYISSGDMEMMTVNLSRTVAKYVNHDLCL